MIRRIQSKAPVCRRVKYSTEAGVPGDRPNVVLRAWRHIPERYRLSAAFAISYVGLRIGHGAYHYVRDGEKDDDGSKPKQTFLALDYPTRSASRLMGKAQSVRIPKPMRRAVYKSWEWAVRADLSEASKPIEEYESLRELFTRQLRDGARPIDPEVLVSPCDGVVTSCGEVGDDGIIDAHVKGWKYTVKQLVGSNPTETGAAKSSLHYAIIYLGPGDYHRIHAPSDWTPLQRRHFPGPLLPVKDVIARVKPKVHATNERVSLEGTWNYGYFSLTAVGAFGVGSIDFQCDPSLECNTKRNFSELKMAPSETLRLPDVKHVKGAEIGCFNLGSTVVLLFEAPAGFAWDVGHGVKVQVGQKLGRKYEWVETPKPVNVKVPASETKL